MLRVFVDSLSKGVEMKNVTLCATQMACSWDIDDNIARAEGLVRAAASEGAEIILLQELFETPYFCIDEDPKYFSLAKSRENNPLIQHFSTLAKDLGVVLPISFFERAGQVFFNSLVVADADGTIKGLYRKSHIPQNPGYEEKFYFSPGNTGFQVIDTKFARLGCAICWDQWFPEAARAMTLMGAEVLLYPTAIGSEPEAPELDSAAHWQRVMQGHAAANVIPVVASNRVGSEAGKRSEITFYGSSFITDFTGAKIAEADRQSETHILATVDLFAASQYRDAWCIFRDRRVDLYDVINSLEGIEKRHDTG